MNSERPKPKNVEEYIALFPTEKREKLEEIRSLIKSAAPATEEMISYAIPAYKLGKFPVIYFAGYDKHIGIYPLPHDISQKFAEKIQPFVKGKGTLRFSLDEPLPTDLIREVIRYRLLEAKKGR